MITTPTSVPDVCYYYLVIRLILLALPVVVLNALNVVQPGVDRDDTSFAVAVSKQQRNNFARWLTYF
jgi:hypothetical protein